MADDVRQRLAAAAADSVEEVVGVIKQALAAEQTYSIKCHHCHKDWKYPFPDVSALVRAAQFLIDNGIGKPAQQRLAPVEAKASVRTMEELSDEELLALIKEDEDGETDGGAA